MGKYFVIQLKRIGRILPLILCVMAILFGGISLVYQSLVSQWSDPDKYDRLSVAMVGTANERLLNIGFHALTTMDSSNVTVEFLQMEEEEAGTALERGQIEAYVVFPENFMDNAMGGNIIPLQFVSVAGGENLVSMVKDELTSAFANLLLTSEQGAFAIGDVLAENGESEIAWQKTNDLALDYALRVMDRSLVYTVEELGISDGLTFEQYLMSGLAVVFLFFMTLPFVGVLIKEEASLEQLLKSKRVGACSQVLCEIVAYILWVAVAIAVPVLILTDVGISSLVQILPVVLCVCGISYLVYSLTRDVLSGVLLQLMTSVAMCFVAGCMYPVYFFPVSVQKFSEYLPAAMARNHMAGLITGKPTDAHIVPLLAIGAGCVLVSMLIRHVRIGGRKGARL